MSLGIREGMSCDGICKDAGVIGRRSGGQFLAKKVIKGWWDNSVTMGECAEV